MLTDVEVSTKEIYHPFFYKKKHDGEISTNGSYILTPK